MQLAVDSHDRFAASYYEAPPAGSMIDSPPRTELLKILGWGFGLAVVVGNTIGAGILRTPGDVALHSGSVAAYLAIWCGGALYALLGANVLAELGTAIPRSGGQYAFAHEALGPYPGFIVGWSDWLSTAGSAAAVSAVIGEYTHQFIPVVDPVFVAVSAILLFTLVQWQGMRGSQRTQNFASALKGLAFVAFIAICFFAGTGESSTAAAGRTITLAGVVIALQAVIYTYDGWTGPIYFSEELGLPARDIPRAMFGGICAVATIYLLLNVAFLLVVPLSSLAGSSLAAGVVADRVFGPDGSDVLRFLTIVSMLGAVSAFLLMAPRVLLAMARDRLAPRAATRVSGGGTPRNALAVTSATAILFVVSGPFQRIIAYLAFFFVANYAISFTAYFILRRTRPELPRPYRAVGHPFLPAVALLGSIAFLVAAVVTDRGNSIVALVLLAASLPLYRLTRKVTTSAA